VSDGSMPKSPVTIVENRWPGNEPKSGLAVKVINHLGDEVVKVFKV
jgi:hypothetical protein